MPGVTGSMSETNKAYLNDKAALLLQPACDGSSVHRSSIIQQWGLFGGLTPITSEISSTTSAADTVKLYLNTQERFCLLAVGVQNGGKSHTVGAVVENCMLQLPGIIHSAPTATSVMHYDEDTTAQCELSTLTAAGADTPRSVDVFVRNTTVLVSPNYFQQMLVQEKYRGVPNTSVQPLLLDWDVLSADQLKIIMQLSFDQVSSSSVPHYFGALLNKLPEYQRCESMPPYHNFREQLSSKSSTGFTSSQMEPLELRLKLLDAVVQQSAKNVRDYSNRKTFMDAMQDAYDTQGIVIADLSDPLISKQQANCIFQVVLQQFCNKEWNGDKPVRRKLVVFDEAHKYISNDGDGLAHEMLKVVRTMRLTGMRIVVSTQSPAELPHEMLAL
ncbi:hypothetical protein JKP88DRAFT_252197 [Tribonema minus]|uniref:Uncharacterized protein n=1 Tax=Tribonema minus TaxID=303371 RepID=A0A835ZH89_9STRA|nr:hypothetical protein JKP88DRAFT_252197 [Tribonema minus]